MKWTILDSITRFQGFFRMVEYKFQLERYNGGVVEMTREVFERGTAAAVLAYDPAADAVVLIEQFRPGAIRQDNPWLTELIAGIVEEGESAEDVVVREAVEEAGCVIQNPLQIAHYLVSPGGTTEEVTIFVATCDSSQLPEYGGLDSEEEDIKVLVVPRDQFLARLQRGEIDNAMTLVAAQWLALNFELWREQNYM